MNGLDIEEEYYFELVELINTKEDNFLVLEKGYDDTVVNTINRCLHSLKGNCGMLELMELETLFHRMETQFIQEAKTKNIEVEKYLTIIDKTREYFESPTETLVKESLTILNKPIKEPSSEEEAINSYLNVFHLDDEEDILEIIALQLEGYGCKVKSFTNATALKDEILKGNIPDLFIVDFNMPDQNGAAVINGLNSILPSIPKILLSGFVTKEVMFECINRGVLGILEKPFDSFYLQRLLKKAEKIKKQNSANKEIFSLSMEFETLTHDEIKATLHKVKAYLK